MSSAEPRCGIVVTRLALCSTVACWLAPVSEMPIVLARSVVFRRARSAMARSTAVLVRPSNAVSDRALVSGSSQQPSAPLADRAVQDGLAGGQGLQQ